MSVVTASCTPWVRANLTDESVDLIFSDPPYCIGYDYGDEFDDNMTPDEYSEFSRDWLSEMHRVLTPTGTFWLTIGDEWVADLRVMCREIGFHLRSWIVWHYTFGVNSPKKFTRSHAHLLYFTKHPTKFTFNADQVRVPSARETVYNDKRANPTGRLPDDTWIIRPQEVPDTCNALSDTWYVPRINGSFKERIPGAANQLPEQLLGRVIRGCSNPGDLVFDPMVGTGTTLAVAKKLGRAYLGCEQSAVFAKIAEERLAACKFGDALDGTTPHGG